MLKRKEKQLLVLNTKYLWFQINQVSVHISISLWPITSRTKPLLRWLFHHVYITGVSTDGYCQMLILNWWGLREINQLFISSRYVITLHIWLGASRMITRRVVERIVDLKANAWAAIFVENICREYIALSYYHHPGKSEVWNIIHCLGLGHDTMVCIVCLFIFLLSHTTHDADVIIGPRWRLKSPASRLFTLVQIKENIKVPRHWPLCGEFTGDLWIPRSNGQ